MNTETAKQYIENGHRHFAAGRYDDASIHYLAATTAADAELKRYAADAADAANNYRDGKALDPAAVFLDGWKRETAKPGDAAWNEQSEIHGGWSMEPRNWPKQTIPAAMHYETHPNGARTYYFELPDGTYWAEAPQVTHYAATEQEITDWLRVEIGLL